jgi:hypothetical protein
MTHCAPRFAACLLAVLLTAVSPAPAAFGFADLARLIAAHPLHGVLLEYDRQIAALRSTQNLSGLGNPASAASSGGASVRRDAAAAQREAARLASERRNRSARENRALTVVLAMQHAGDPELNAFAADLNRETTASFTAYEDALGQRSERAYAARTQQLREKELTLAFDLAKADAGQRLSLRLKLHDLHLTPTARVQLEAQLAALGDRESKALTAMRRNDAAVLAAYRSELERESAGATSSMASNLRSKADANFAVRRTVTHVESSLGARRNLPSQVAAFRADDRTGSDAARVSDAIGAAGDDIARRFGQLGAIDTRSAHETAAQIQRLAQMRAALYRWIVGEIERDARAAASKHHITRVRFAGTPQKGSVDLTGEIRADLARR